ncbi:potassium-transporting ATPase subunit KdpA [Dyadobacter arcticus]|uniref:Potassium-transporting ATPase potassium-binding subunit n=1 Tax=Dyadobacter arcticus TaxID=1078754 RepID=A0ABX0UTW4_9BACT|nr:potassium-transporting ATPase subunit KdpA [Dyadobacter arcticus]NIJ55175.1 K+-transporting ATPase ATPase A chain [Dyadobacter arcticus]
MDEINLPASLILFSVVALFSWPLGKYMSQVYSKQKSFSDFFEPVEDRIFKWLGIDPHAEMGLKQYLTAFLLLNLVWLVYAFFILLFQGDLMLNPAGNPSMDWTLALHSAISFITSTNLQHYSGESGATYFSQLAVFTFLQFVSASASLAVGVAVVRSLAKTDAGLGNFYFDFVRSATRILFPLSVLVSVFFLFRGMPMTFDPAQQVVSMQGDTTIVASGPVAAMISIKELGSNGGGYYGTNDAHPFENPDQISFVIHYIIVLLLPLAFVFFIGFYLKNHAFAKMIFAVMIAGFIMVCIPIIYQEIRGNPNIGAMGIDISGGNMEGKEVRYGSFYSALYAGENASVPAGTIASMHDSFMPLSGLFMLIAMQIDCFFGGLGTGWINLFLYLVVAVFLGSLMIGRTPEVLGRKLGIREIQLAVIASVAQILVPMVLAGLACYVYNFDPAATNDLGWLSNQGPHGLSTMFYEYVSSVAGNGSGFEGLGDNTPFWNLSTSLAMLTGRFVPIIAALSIGWMLSKRKAVESTAGTLKVESTTFGIFLFLTIIILNALSSFPVYALGPLSEYFSQQ